MFNYLFKIMELSSFIPNPNNYVKFHINDILIKLVVYPEAKCVKMGATCKYNHTFRAQFVRREP